MKLIKFRIKDFRSIEDSTWIDCGEVTNIIGVNESGKSNSLIALWKLNPARDGEINLIEDLPRNKYAEWRNNYKNIIFIETYFELDDDLCKKLSELTLHSEEEFKILYLARKYNGHYIYQFKDEKSVEKCSLLDIIVNDTLRMYKNDDIRMYNFNCITDTIVEVITTCNTYTLLTVHLL